MNSTNTQQVVKKESHGDDLLSGKKKRGRKSLKNNESICESNHDLSKRPKSITKHFDVRRSNQLLKIYFFA